MRKNTLHILITVIVASLACILGILVLEANLDTVSKQYELNITQAMSSKQAVSNISEAIYRTESFVWQHIVTDDEEVYERCESQIAMHLESIPEQYKQLEQIFEGEQNDELLHEVVRQYVGFKSNVDVVLKLSRNGSKQSAQYYVDLKLNPYFDMVNSLIGEITATSDEINVTATQKMEESIVNARVVGFFCAVLVGGICLVAISMVFRSGKKIIGQQEEEQRIHQQKVMELQYNTILGMANLIEGRDSETGEHVKRTSWYVDKIARQLAVDSDYQDQLTDSYLENLKKAAPLHDIGKIKVPDAILQKPGRLTKEEFEIMKCHASEGGGIVYETLASVEEKEYIELAHDVARYHHERWDGTGYPDGRKGEQIPLCARIMAVADVFDALTSKRCYKEAMPIDEAYRIIEASIGTHFDPVVAEAFIKLRPEVEAYLSQNQKSL